MKTEDRLRAAINGVKTATSDVMKAQQRLRQVAPTVLLLELDQALKELRYTEEMLARGLREPAEARVAQ